MPNPLSIVPTIDHRTIRIESAHSLLIIKNGQIIDQMTPECALEVAAAMTLQARRAIEMQPEVAKKLALDQALLLRAGAPIGLTDNRKIQEEAVKEAVSNRDLRRAMPGGVQSTEVVGAPALIQHDPPKQE